MKNIISHSVVLENHTTMYSIPIPRALNYIDVSINGEMLVEDKDYTIDESQDITVLFNSTIKMNSTLLINYELMDPIVDIYIPPIALSNVQKMKNNLNKYLKVLGSIFIKAPAIKN